MVNRSLCRLAFLLTVVSLSSRIQAKVAPAEFSNLAREADAIVLGTVVGGHHNQGREDCTRESARDTQGP
jgi:hypothetical protein